MSAARCLMLISYLIDRKFLRTLDDQYRRRQVVDQCSMEGTASGKQNPPMLIVRRHFRNSFNEIRKDVNSAFD